MKPIRALCLLVLAAMPLQAYRWTVPGVVRTNGVGGTVFVSDVWITNPNAAALTVTLSFLPGGGGAPPSPHPYTVQAGETLVLSNVLQQTWGLADAWGALLVDAPLGEADRPVQVRARTYNNTSGGTYGAALPILGETDFLAAGAATDAIWLSHNPFLDTDFRTNVAVVTTDAGGALVHLSAYDAAGGILGQATVPLAGPGFAQVVGSALVPAKTLVGRVRFEVLQGHASGYIVTVDNVTGDSSIFPFGPAPTGSTDVVLSGVASRVPGRSGTFWRTDARLFNPGTASHDVTLSFLAAGRNNGTPLDTHVVTLAPGQVSESIDVLAAQFGELAGSSGALRVESDAPVMALARTSNLDPSGVRKGTFGAQQLPAPVSGYATASDEGLSLTGLRENASYRTNIGLAAGPDGATFTFTVADRLGAAIGSGSGSLPPFGWWQPGILALTGLPSIPDDARILIKLSTGSLSAYSSQIDNGSGDGVVTPAVRQQAPCALQVGVSISPSPACAGTQVSLLADVIAGATYSWTVPSGVTVDSALTANPLLVHAAGGFDYSVLVSSGRCRKSASGTVAVTPSLAMTPPFVSSSPAQNAPVTVSWGYLAGSPTAQTIAGTELPTVTLDPTARSYTFTPSTTGSHTATVSGSSSCGSDAKSVVFTVAPPCTMPSAAFHPPATVQAHSTFTLAMLSGAKTYSWAVQGATIQDAANGRIVTIVAGNTGSTITVTATASNGPGCVATETDTIAVVPPPATISDFTAKSTTVPVGGTTQISFVVTDAYSWGLSGDKGATFSIPSSHTSGTWQVVYTRHNPGAETVTLSVRGLDGGTLSASLVIN